MPVSFVAAAAILASSAAPEAPAAAGARVFLPADFAVFAPRTALDMVDRVPGFALDQGDDERRGFSGGAGNALIDGARPSTKNQSVREVLSRIPAAQVARIELITGAAAAADAPGQASLVNVVRLSTGGAGNWEIDLERARSGRVSPRGEASWSGRLAALDVAASLDRYFEHRPLSGDIILEDGAGARTGLRADVTPRTFRELEGTFSVGGRLWEGDFKLNASRGRWQFATTLNSREQDAFGAARGGFDFTLVERREDGEIGADYARDVGPLSLTILALARQTRFSGDTERRDLPASGGGRSAQSERDVAEERIVRLSAQWPLDPAHRVDFGIEAAENTLRSRLVLAAVSALPAANVEVEEQRAEIFLTHAWRLSPSWSSEAAIRVETSELTQSGDSDARTAFTFWKPSFQIARRIGDGGDQARLKVFRDVGQLDFNDFASRADLFDAGRVSAGNQNLAPSNSWRLEAGLNKRFGPKAALSATLFREWVSDVNDVVPISSPQGVFDGPGNLGDGDIRGLELDAAAPLDRLFPGATLTLNATLQQAEVTDPITGRQRPLSEFAELDIDAEFRQDFAAAKLAWGVEVNKRSEIQFYRRGEVESYEEGAFVEAYLETTAIRGLKVQLWGKNLMDAAFSRGRVFSAPDRSAPISSAERRKRRFGPLVGIQIQGAF
jgi:hypothetical protein